MTQSRKLRVIDLSRLWKFLFAGACAFLLQAHQARAELGAAADTVKTDQLRFKGAHSESSSAQMTTHEIRMRDGSAIKEYVNATGVVFAVTWRTRLKPDLSALLGAQFPVLSATAGVVPGVAGIRGQHSIRQPGLVVHQGGRMNAFVGLAYMPALVPEGINAEALR